MQENKRSGKVLKLLALLLVYILSAAAGYLIAADDPFSLPSWPAAGVKEETEEKAADTEEETGKAEDPEREEAPAGEDEKEAQEKAEQDAAAALEKAEKEREKELTALAQEDPWKAFESLDYCMIGDSRVSGFSIYGFLDQKRVFAEDGAIITMMRDYYTSFEALAPERVFISFGINDMITGFWNTPEEYAEKVLKETTALKEHAPGAVYYINSILPALPPALNDKEIWKQVPEFNEALREMCRENGFVYIDNTSLVEEHEDLYARDGIHVGPDFYGFWGKNMLSFYAGDRD